MVVTSTVKRTKGNSGPSAEKPFSCDRGGNFSQVNKEPSDDDVGPNPTRGRHTSDDRQLKTRRKELRIGTWNVRTLYKAGQYENLLSEMSALNLDILGIAETRWNDDGRISNDQYEFIYSGGEKHQHGTGIMMKKSVASCMVGFWPVSDRIIMVKLKGKPFNINIIQIYAPTTEHDDDEVENFYNDIENVMKYTKSGEINIVMGDWNAKVGEQQEYPVTGKFGLGDRNDRGQRLVDFCWTAKLVVTNTLFEHPNRRLYTWKSPGDIHRNQIDYIMINQRHRNSVKQVRTYPGADIGSDHNPVIMTLSVKLKHPKKKQVNAQLDMNMLKDTIIREKYNITVQNRYQELMNEGTPQDQDDIEKQWTALRESMTKAAEENLPKKAREKKQPWMTNEILEKMKKRKKTKNVDPVRYSQLKKEIEKECTKAKEEWWNKKCEEVEQLEAKHESRAMHEKIKEITGQGSRKRGSNCIKDKDGKLLFDEDEIKTRWEEYVSELYDDNRGDQPEIEDENGEEVLLSEVEKAIKELKSGKAAGNDMITSEMIKALDDAGVEIIHKLVNNIYKTGNIPSDMNESIFIRLPKKPKATMCTEYRTLSLMSHVLKVILKVLLNRNRKKIENEISSLQSGFMSKKGTREGIFNMRMLCERYCEMSKDIYACFIDYEKAFDRVNHEIMIKCLKDIGLNGKDIKLIVNLYWTQKAYIQLEQDLSGEIMIKRGVRQGCVLSPCLFNLYTEMIFRHIEEMEGVIVGGVSINNLRYADDTVLLAESEESLQDIMNEVNIAGKTFNMKMNAKKTKTMIITKKADKPKINTSIDGTCIEQVAQFPYLGQKITEDGRCEEEIKRRINIAKTTFSKMTKILTSRKINVETRKRILQCYVWSTLLYGAETWTISENMAKRLSALEMWCYRRMLRISWTEKITNEEVLQKAEIKKRLYTTIQTKKLQYFGHIIRQNGEPLYRTVLEGKVNGTRGRGRPRDKWTSNITKWTGLQYHQAVGLAQQRKKWRAIASNPRQDGTG
jgi:hypothetical protein